MAVNCGPTFPIIINHWPESESNFLAADLWQNNVTFDGVVGPEPSVSILANAYQAKSSKNLLRSMNQSLFACTSVIAPRLTFGRMRPATPEPTELTQLAEWMQAFDQEALPTATHASIEAMQQVVKKRIEAGNFFVWENENKKIVSMAGFAGPTETSVRINAVYTPHQFRKNGFASQLVASMTSLALKSKKNVTLYTDKLNPTSNKIYQAIGYQFVGDSAHIRFQ